MVKIYLNYFECAKLKQGAKIVLHSVQNPELFGVAKINKKKKF